MKSLLKIADIKNESYVNGPGVRTVVWVQGCSIRCKGCFNPSLQNFDKGRLYHPEDLAKELSEISSDGLTISGGEPLDQNNGLYQMIKYFKLISGKAILLFTGYGYKQIKKSPKKLRTVLSVDAAVCGSYKEGAIWCNKQLLLITRRISPNDIKPHNNLELSIRDGHAFLTGYPNI